MKVLSAMTLAALVPLSLATGCVDDQGNSVDWFAAFKFPGGKTYAYADANSPTLKKSAGNLEKGAVASTLKTLYGASKSDGMWAMFNDEPTNANKQGDTFAHQKGVMYSSSTSGFWLVHSVPKFPVEHGKKYTYPLTQSIFGQSFLCMTLSPTSLDSVAKALLTSRPFVYDSNVPPSFASKYPSFASLVTNPAQSPPVTTPVTLKLTTMGRHTFTAFEKSGHWNQDLYEDLVAPALKSDLYAETWMRPAMKTYCKPAHPWEVVNIITLSMAGESWKETQDHSKWVISQKGSSVCIGGVNRMESQRLRGGGTVCFTQSSLWGGLSRAITSKDKCSIFSNASNASSLSNAPTTQNATNATRTH